MNEQQQAEQLRKFLDREKADYSITLHEQSFKTASEGALHFGIGIHETTPTLIVKTKHDCLAVIISGHMRIAFKKLKAALGEKELSLADPETVYRVTGARVGEVCLINPALRTILDQAVLANPYCYGGCGFPKSTLKIKTEDLIRLTSAKVLDFTELRT